MKSFTLSNVIKKESNVIDDTRIANFCILETSKRYLPTIFLRALLTPLAAACLLRSKINPERNYLFFLRTEKVDAIAKKS